MLVHTSTYASNPVRFTGSQYSYLMKKVHYLLIIKYITKRVADATRIIKKLPVTELRQNHP